MKKRVLSLWLAAGLAHAFNVSHSPAVVAFMGVVDSLKVYQADHQKLPVDWQSLVASGAMSEVALAAARKNCDFENRYHFLNPPLEIEVSGKKEKVILMANRAGKEGNLIVDRESGGAFVREGRFLAVVTADGKIEMRRYSEVGLKRVFEQAGRNLESETFLETSSQGADAEKK